MAEGIGDRELHVVLTVRDVARQIPFVLAAGAPGRPGLRLRRVRGLRPQPPGGGRPQLLERPGRPRGGRPLADGGAARAGPRGDVPPAGASPGSCSKRFSTLLDVPVDRLDADVARRNTSIGRVQGEVLRRVNAALPERYRQRQLYGDVGKRFFATGVLGGQEGERALVPAEHEDWCREYAESVVTGVRERGLHVVGDLADLLPDPASFARGDQAVAEAEVAAAATAALATVLEQRMDQLAESRRRPRPGPARTPPPPPRRPLPRRVAGRLRRLVTPGR